MFRKVLCSLLLLKIIICPIRSQDMRVFRDIFREAEAILLYLDEEKKALQLFLELDRMDPGSAHIQYKIGLCYLNIQGEKEKAIPCKQ